MSRITPIHPAQAKGEAADLLGAVQSAMGMTPNFLRVLAQSPVALRSFLGLHAIASEGALDPVTRERIALFVAQQNACAYCVSAHTAIGRKAGLDGEEMLANRQCESADAKAAAALAFASALVEHTAMSPTANWPPCALPGTAMPRSWKSSPMWR